MIDIDADRHCLMSRVLSAWNVSRIGSMGVILAIV